MTLPSGTRLGPYEILELADGQRFLYLQLVAANAAAATTQTATPDHVAGLMLAMNWAASLKK
jgi:hypothetical protein